MNCKILLSVSLVLLFSVCKAQQNTSATSTNYSKDTAAVDALISKSKELFGDAPEEAIRISIQAKDLAIKIKFEKGLANAYKSIGIGYYNQAKYLEAVDNWTKSLQVFEKIKDDNGISNILNNIGAVYMNQGDDENALKYYLQSLNVSERTGDKLRMVTAMNNVGAVYFHKTETHNKALEYYERALKLSEEIKDDYGIGTTSVNLGEIYLERNKNSEALFYFKKSLTAYEKGSPESVPYSLNDLGKVYVANGNFTLALNSHSKALTISQKLNSKLDMVQSLLGLAKTYEKSGDLKAAIIYYSQAESFGKEIKSYQELQEIYKGLASVYSSSADFKNAFKYQILYTDTKNALYNIEADKKMASMQFDFDLQKKQGQINLLTKDKALQDVEIKRQRLARNTLIVGLLMAFIVAFVIYRSYRIKAKNNKILDRKNVEIEGLILNILPSEVAKELQATGEATPKYYDNVSVLFTDFKGFTLIAEKMSPAEVVKELNTCFIAFDGIVKKYHLEKIKTIGDSYMCAGGIPSQDKDHAYKIVSAAMEMLVFIDNYNKNRLEKGLEVWDVRIGIHAGPVVAGVVGKMKYAYDIWGSTVNIASRMETNGSPGIVNVSAAIYEQIKDKYECNYRGKIYAKNVGEIDMYFVDHKYKPLEETIAEENLLDSRNG